MTTDLVRLLSRKRRRPGDKEVWVHPELSRVLKGSDYKLSSDKAEEYWMDRQRKHPSIEEDPA